MTEAYYETTADSHASPYAIRHYCPVDNCDWALDHVTRAEKTHADRLAWPVAVRELDKRLVNHLQKHSLREWLETVQRLQHDLIAITLPLGHRCETNGALSHP